ncbi:MAG TPA: electron transport complex subunit RsxB [Burkholderiales bacterium]|nr:electron transport complex subunit RsxB [Burkholderiales bacterium]
MSAFFWNRLRQNRQNSLADRIDGILPQTQCGQCSFPGCRPYAEAIAEGRADINQCPPGGQQGVVRLAHLLQRQVKPLDPSHGEPKPPAKAKIDELTCIGCTLCIKACPVDAIIGAAKQMHTIISQECTGCELCLAPCPVDCISMYPVETLIYDRDLARRRHLAHSLRFQKIETEKRQRMESRQEKSLPDQKTAHADLIKTAIERAKTRQSQLECRTEPDEANGKKIKS